MNKVNRILTTTVLAGACMTFAGYASADDTGAAGGGQRPPQRNFQQLKQSMIELQQETITVMQKGLSCMQAATDFRALRECGRQEHMEGAQLREKAHAMFPRAGGRRPGGQNGGYGGGPNGGPAGGPDGAPAGGPGGGAPGNY